MTTKELLEAIRYGGPQLWFLLILWVISVATVINWIYNWIKGLF